MGSTQSCLPPPHDPGLPCSQCSPLGRPPWTPWATHSQALEAAKVTGRRWPLFVSEDSVAGTGKVLAQSWEGMALLGGVRSSVGPERLMAFC